MLFCTFIYAYQDSSQLVKLLPHGNKSHSQQSKERFLLTLEGKQTKKQSPQRSLSAWAPPSYILTHSPLLYKKHIYYQTLHILYLPFSGSDGFLVLRWFFSPFLPLTKLFTKLYHTFWIVSPLDPQTAAAETSSAWPILLSLIATVCNPTAAPFLPSMEPVTPAPSLT